MRSLPASALQGERLGVEVDPGDELEQGFVDAAEFLRAEVGVVDGLAAFALERHPRQRAEGGEQIEVGHFSPVQQVAVWLVGNLDRACVGVVQPAQRGDAELG